MTRPSVILTRKQLEQYPEYSCSLPTGTTIGKVWRRNQNAFRLPPDRYPEKWVLGQYVKREGDEVLISWMTVILKDEVPA